MSVRLYVVVKLSKYDTENNSLEMSEKGKSRVKSRYSNNRVIDNEHV